MWSKNPFPNLDVVIHRGNGFLIYCICGQICGQEQVQFYHLWSLVWSNSKPRKNFSFAYYNSCECFCQEYSQINICYAVDKENDASEFAQ